MNDDHDASSRRSGRDHWPSIWNIHNSVTYSGQSAYNVRVAFPEQHTKQQSIKPPAKITIAMDIHQLVEDPVHRFILYTYN